MSEEVLCHPAREYFRSSLSVCNLTMTNGGMSWFCARPKNKHILCDNWVDVSRMGWDYIMNDAEKLLIR